MNRGINRKIRILILTTSFPLYEGHPAGPFILEQARFLRYLGNQVTVLAPHHEGSHLNEEMEGVRVHRFRYFRPARMQTLCYGSGVTTNLSQGWLPKFQLPLLVLGFIVVGFRLANKSDIIQANWTLTGLAGVILGIILSKPVVLHIHGAEKVLIRNNPLGRFIVKRSDHVVANSKYSLQVTRAAQEPRAYTIISPGIDIERFRGGPVSPALREHLTALGVDLSVPIVFSLGRLIEIKGHRYLIDAISIIRRKQPVQLVIAGIGPLLLSLQQQAKDLGLSDCIFFLGHVPYSEIPDHHRMAQVFAMPSIVDYGGVTEGLGMALLEAMACEIPCVASRIGGIVDIVKDEHNALFSREKDAEDLANKLSKLLNDHRLRAQLSLEARRFVEDHYSWIVKAHELDDMYRNIISD